MKVALISAILIIIACSKTIAGDYIQYLPKSFEGYMVYEMLSSDGRKSIVKMPVRYVIGGSGAQNNENEENNKYNLELEKGYKNQSWNEKPMTEDEKINIAAYYPLYLD